METKKPGLEDAFFSGRRTDSGSRSGCYESASDIADDLKSPLLAELELTGELQAWERNLSLLSDYGWVNGCARIAQELVRLREASPLDLVAVVGLTEGVHLKPLLCSLAIVMRELLQRVVLVDCDLRAPSLYTVTDSETREGFIDMIKYGCSFFTAATETELGGVYVIAAGSHPVSSEGELQGRELERVFHSLRAKADMTLVSVPPFVGENRINPILEHMDGVLLCVNRIGSRKASVESAFSRLWQSDIPVVGIASQETSEPDAGGAGLVESSREESGYVEASTESTPPETEVVHEEEGESVRSTGAAELESVGEVVPAMPLVQDVPLGQEGPPEEESEEKPSPDETDAVETALFGRKRGRRKLPYIIGICAAATIMGFLGVREAGFFGPERPEMDSRTARSILLPGSDGVTNAVEQTEEMSGTPAEDVSSFSESTEPSTGRASVPDRDRLMADEADRAEERQIPEPVPAKAIAQPSGKTEKDGEGSQIAPATLGAAFVHISSFRDYEKAAKDSSRIAAAGLETSIVLVTFEDLGTWYRVLVGPFARQTDAEAASAKLVSSGLVKKTRIISEGGTD